ncbi:PilZ domain-containing protein [Ureibacillus aquaedulcis]|uniref:PilZ domain-containing protein n=1 Tax=Ureibacillus aquaedulcis TaxID=3058421 RepID=A0ABT8GLD6_9BACL|nr:PilZ domain-containing protein [Ureibacillus sp. BA0131]MDN4492228.1 PilZ domain-containing protein [Ureibacillus sp. BA0131]
MNGQPLPALDSCPCQILDISPRGMKMFSEVKLGEYLNKAALQIELQFVLDVTTIQAVGEIVWRKPFGRGDQYGILFQAQKNLDELIIKEMKLRRKKEVMQSKPYR